MKKLNSKIAIGVTALMSVLLIACQKPTDTANPSAPSMTVGTQVDDAVISSSVSAALMANKDINSYDIKVEVRKAEVMLSGFVDNQFQIDQAVALVNAVKGVTKVDNKLTIKEQSSSIGDKIDDSVITTKVKASLLADDIIKSFDISVVSNNGEVQLSGFVENTTQIERATELASKVAGVQKVINMMSIKK